MKDVLWTCQMLASTISPADLDAALSAGRALTLEQAIALALEAPHG